MKLIKNIALFSSLFLLFSSAYADIQVQDHTKQFIEGYQALQNKSPNASKRYIIQYEKVKDPQVCSIFFEGHPLPLTPQVDSLLNKYVTELPTLIPIYQKKVPVIKLIAKEVEERTERLFGMKINAKIMVGTSVARTDAVTTGSNQSKYATIALNMHEMMRYSDDELRIVLSHELFHVLQHQFEKDHSNSEMIAGNIYSEGWATYASSLVYPGFSDWKYISYFTKNDRQFKNFESNRKAIIHDLLRDWNSRNERKFDKYFSADIRASTPFEPRSGYYIGYLAAKKLAEKTSPVEVALISYRDFKKQIKPLLKEMSEVS